MTHSSPRAIRYFRRNWLAFFGDYLFFGVGLTFASGSTTLPAFVASLTGNTVIIGAVSSVLTGVWLLPQIFAANYLTDKPRKYPFMMTGELIGRASFPLFVIWLLVTGVRYKTLTLVFFFAMLVFFWSFDAFVALAWSDLFGKAIAPEKRGRLMGLAQAATGILSIPAGIGIRYLLSSQGPAYPANYTIIFALASVGFWGSMVCCGMIVEMPEATPETRPAWRDYLPHLTQLWSRDRAFSRVTIIRLLTGVGAMSTAFYVVYAIESLHLPTSAIGLFATANTLGVALAGFIFGTLADRHGPQSVIRVSTWLAFSVPVLALVINSGVLGGAVSWVYPVLYILLGLIDGGAFMGFWNYVLEIAPPGHRPTYMGLTNTIVGLTVLLPIFGGFLLGRTSYMMLFALTAIGTLAGALLGASLPNPRAAGFQRPMLDGEVPEHDSR